MFETDFEIRLSMSSVVEMVPEEDVADQIPFIHYKVTLFLNCLNYRYVWLQFKPIASIEDIEVGRQIDVIGIVMNVEQPRRITKRNGDETINRRITIRDDTNCSIEVCNA